MSQENAQTAINIMRLASDLSMGLTQSSTDALARDYKCLVGELTGVRDKESIAFELLRFNRGSEYYTPAELALMFRGVLDKLND